MLKFILKGLLRDRSRSLFPVITVTIGVIVAVLMYAYISGLTEDLIETNAKFSTGHVKLVTRAYAELIEQQPIDLAMIDIEEILENVGEYYPGIEWTERIYFGGLIDVPDEVGETQEQTFFGGIAADLLTPDSMEHDLLNPQDAIVRGRMIENEDEILLSDQLAKTLRIEMGDIVTLISETIDGHMAFRNFEVVGTVLFGVTLLDRSALLADIGDVRRMLDMEGAASELLGYLPSFDSDRVDQLAAEYNEEFSDPDDEFSPYMLSLLDHNNLRGLFAYAENASTIMIAVFIFIMSVVLWNAGLMNGIRRYGEIGVRLAIGEGKFRLYRVMIYEAAFIGLAGSVIGTAIGLAFSYYWQAVGIDISGAMPDIGMMMSDSLRTKVTTGAYLIGFIPGLLATTLGAALAGTGIFKRNTAQLFKELEA